jgi:Hsp20/alpha crystallin family
VGIHQTTFPKTGFDDKFFKDPPRNSYEEMQHRQNETDNKKGKYQYRERFVGQFQRALTLPGSANAAKMTTEYANGVLTITIPKS